jgi:hypothetical protein
MRVHAIIAQLRNPAARRQAIYRQAPAEAALRVNAVLDASQKVFDQFQARGRAYKVDRAPLIKTYRGLLEPLFSGGLRAEQRCRSRQNLREIPGVVQRQFLTLPTIATNPMTSFV